MGRHVIHSFFDKETSTFSYVVYSPHDLHSVIIDPVLNYQQESGRITSESADTILEFVKLNRLHVDYILETHAHADHLSAGHYLQEKTGGLLAIGENIREVQQVFKSIFNLNDDDLGNKAGFDVLLKDKERIHFGELSIEAISVPGHTPACMAYKIEDCLFVGDTLFMPDVGTARCDFPGGDARTLFQSVHKILSYPEYTTLYLCHDYPPPNRTQLEFKTTVKDQKENNIHIHSGISEEAFVALRIQRDKTLNLPNLIIPAIQINIRGGRFPTPENNGISYLKIPINYF